MKVIGSEAEERQLLYSKILEVKFEGESGYVEFDPNVGDRLPIKMEVVNIYVRYEGI